MNLFKKIHNLIKLGSTLKISEDGKNVLISSDKNIILDSRGSILLQCDGYLVELATQIHLNPEISKRFDASTVIDDADIARIKKEEEIRLKIEQQRVVSDCNKKKDKENVV